MENQSITNKLIYKTMSNTSEGILLCCCNCFQSETNLYHCTNQLCNTYFCKKCLDNNFSSNCFKCKTGKYVIEGSSQMKKNDTITCLFCKKKFNSQKELKNHFFLECEYIEINCPICHSKVPKIQFISHLCNPVINNQMIDYLKESNQNLISILGNVTHYFNKNDNIQTSSNTSNNLIQSNVNNEDTSTNLNNVYSTINQFTSKIEERFNRLFDEINELKIDRNIICTSCKSKKPTEFCKSCSKRLCEECAKKCEICELKICNNCTTKYENCKNDCNNILCTNCLKLIISNKKIQIIENRIEDDRLCTKDRCYRSRSFLKMNKYIFIIPICIFLILYLLFK